MKKRLTQVIVSILLVETVLFGAPIQAGLAVSSSSDNNQADVAPIFFDVPYSYWAWEWIETLYRNGVTNGCSTNPPMYCPEDAVTRAQMAVFLERGVHGSDYQPPAVGSSTGFNDVSTGYWAAAWIKQLAADGITLGCGNNNYCPEELVTRAQMAIFLLRAKHGAGYTPPAVGGSTGFNDLSTDYWAAAWIKQLAAEAITSGCGSGNYCPDNNVTRAEMAVFLVRTFNLLDLEGRLFLDMNGSGLRDKATFNYDPERLADPRQPLQPDLAEVVDDYVSAHPDIKDGDLITIEEPGLSGYTVCAETDCAQTDPQGNFSLPIKSGTSGAWIQIADPNAGTPTLAMRYINIWNSAVTVPSYTQDVDTATMAKIAIITNCDADAEAQVCKQDADTLMVRDQYWNDTKIIPVGDGISIKLGADNNIGLMQGFLTLPFVSEYSISVSNYFDVDPTSCPSGSEPHSCPNIRDWQGNTKTYDQHTGIDFLASTGIPIIAAAPGEVLSVGYDDASGNYAIVKVNDSLVLQYNHMSEVNVTEGEIVERGTQIGLVGSTGNSSRPHLHFELRINDQPTDTFRYIVNLSLLPDPFAGSEVSYWTTDNFPQFSHINSANK